MNRRRRKYSPGWIIKNIQKAIKKSRIYYHIDIYALNKQRVKETTKDCKLPVMLNLLDG